jgi:hypothetical protein
MFAPDCDHVADQPGGVSVCPLAKAKRSVQPLTASPRFVMVMFAVKPPTPGDSVHVLAVYVTRQPAAARAGAASATTTPATVASTAPMMPTRAFIDVFTDGSSRTGRLSMEALPHCSDLWGLSSARAVVVAPAVYGGGSYRTADNQGEWHTDRSVRQAVA